MNSEQVFKALANPIRRDILRWLKQPELYFTEEHFSLENGVCAGQIDAKSGLSQSTMSNHLAILQKADLVIVRKVGQWCFYQRNEVVIQQFLQRLQDEL